MIDRKAIKDLDLKQPYVWLATWFGSGMLNPAPGTWGSVASIPFALLIYHYIGASGLLAGIVFVSALGFWASEKFDKATDGHDNKMIVIDEAAGQWITLLPALYFFGFSPLYIFIAFMLFRALDITKPWPVSHFDKNVEGAAGVMGDDIIAGLIGALIISGVYYYAG